MTDRRLTAYESLPDLSPFSQDGENTFEQDRSNGHANGYAKPLDENWPNPLGEAAYHGLAGDVVRAFAPHSEADPVSLLLQFLAAFGNAAGRGSYLRMEG